MTAEQFIKDYGWNVGFGDLAITDRIRWEMTKFAEAFAKQRVEQAERRGYDAGFAQGEQAFNSLKEASVKLLNDERAKVADLERELDTVAALKNQIEEFAEKQRTELREMREALGHLRWKNHLYAPTSCDACAKAERLLPNQ